MPLERFELSDRPEETFAAYKSNPEWRSIYSFLGNGFWHVTSFESWSGILRSGAIRPNVRGRYAMRFGTISERSYGYHHNYVSLFDFRSPTEEEVIQTWARACDVLTDGLQSLLLLRLDRRRLRRKIIPNSAAWPPTYEEPFGSIPFIEVWYPGEIPVSAITGTFRLPARHGLSDFRPERLP
jgi:hypothetical protein